MIYLKRYLIFLLCTASLVARSQSARDAIIDKEYNKCMAKISAGKMDSADSAAFKMFIYGVQNTGQQLAEREHDYSKALDYTNKAIDCWKAMKDSINEANNRKFKGFLLGQLQRFAEAKVEIDTAILFYSLARKDWGVAVSQYDLAFVYLLEQKPDSAVYFSTKALAYWKDKKDPARVLGVQNLLLYAKIQLKQFEEAAIIQLSSDSLAALKDMHWQPVIDHYFVSQLMYFQQGKKAASARYKKLYSDTKAILRADDVNALSTFENIKLK
jgi:tetratricopeptide (TPR) repeat protein